MRMSQFHNALRVMKNINRSDLEANRVQLTDKEWEHFRSNPYDWFIKAEHEDAVCVWKIIEGRLSNG